MAASTTTADDDGSCCLERQMIELQLISAMYGDQLDFYDPVVKEIVTASDPAIELKAKRAYLLSDVVQLVIEYPTAELHITLPRDYAQDDPDGGKLDAHLRLLDTNITSATLKRMQVRANERLKQFVAANDCNVLTVIQWVDEKREEINDEVKELSERDSVVLSQHSNGSTKSVGSQRPCRLWIYSHHIYCTSKRKLISELADGLHLSGFSRPGKPGFICVEGQEQDCDSFWFRLRSENWQRITIIEKELGIDNKIFAKFVEIPYDQSDFIKYLEENKCSSTVREFLGWN